MEYTISVGDVYETYIGTPDEILYLLNNKPKELKLLDGETLCQDEAMLPPININVSGTEELVGRVIEKIMETQQRTTP